MSVSRAKCSRAHPLRLLLIFFTLWLSACASQQLQQAQTDADQQVVHSPNDSRDYRYLVLANGLRVLLISDPESDKAAASLDVNVGSDSDPQSYQGLAHFLEHMLFLGTDKYPEAGEYQAFISAHGGSHNAYTSFEHTNYFFDIDPAYLDPALDRFSRFFIAPLFTEKYVEREKNAVHSEFMAKIKDDQRRSLDVFKTLVNPQHPFAKFNVGNLDSLAATPDKQPLRQALIAFHDRYYSANVMTLVVSDNRPLDVLEQSVREKFADIPNKHVVMEDIQEPLFGPQQNRLPLMVKIEPERRQRTLTLTFPTADATRYYRHKPLQYIGNILGHEGRGSLHAWLKSQGWVEELSAGVGLNFRGGSTFNLAINLTPEGVKHVDDIVAAIFQTINRIRTTPHQQWLYREQQQLAQQDFRYQETDTPIHYVMSLSSDMQYYAPRDILQGPYVMEGYDKALIDRFLADLVPGNCLITLSAPSVKTDRRTAIYQTGYSVASVTDTELQRWRLAGTNDAITFPQPNPFIADNLTLKSASFDARELQIYRAEHPQLIIEEPAFHVWYKPDQRFDIPRASILASVESPEALKGADGEVMLTMLARLVSDQLNEWSYPAMLAGLSFAITPDQRGLNLWISGYDDKQEVLLTEILNALLDGEFDPQRFENIRREQIRHLENAGKRQPYQRAFERLPETLYRQRATIEQQLQVYRDLSLADITAFRQRLFAATRVDMLVHGNYHLEEARRLAELLRRSLLVQPASIPPLEIVKLDRAQYSLPVSSDYTDAVALMYVQAPDLKKSTRALFGLSAQIMRSDFYTRLRTEKQLGYVVTSGAFPVRDVPGLFFLVQSPVAGAGALQHEIAGYLANRVKSVDDVSELEFNRQRDALILKLTEEPRNLWEQSQKYWRDISQHYYAFDFEQQLVSALRSLTYDQWRTFFRTLLADPERVVWIYATGDFADDKGIDAQPIDDLTRWKRQRAAWQFP